ncbi:MAG: type 2 isopentenyl-diphosphate Delta-isomerase [Chitinophagaceae bacterium]|nr:type 2 isopentenyl-diphosphate Delta-isomerase [Chitinophagaceae bacterium]
MNSNKANLQNGAAETESRKDSHMALALSSQNDTIDTRFYYEPMVAAHPTPGSEWRVQLGQKSLKYPLWISSMTGGTAKTNVVNQRLAKAVAKFGLGMGVGSARIALEDPDKIKDFDLRPVLGKEAPYYLNFGIAQVEKLIKSGSLTSVSDLVGKLDADGVIIHVNPLQEWMQPEGDRIENIPIETIKHFLEATRLRVIVKEVGQGFGYESMKQLLQLPLTAVEFAANGGTNFSKLELLRNQTKSKYLMPFIRVGQPAEEMVDISNRLFEVLGDKAKCRTLIISGGIKTFLDGYYLIRKSKTNALYGQASEMLRHAAESQEALEEFIQYQIEGLILARTFLTIKEK